MRAVLLIQQYNLDGTTIVYMNSVDQNIYHVTIYCFGRRLNLKPANMTSHLVSCIYNFIIEKQPAQENRISGVRLHNVLCQHSRLSVSTTSHLSHHGEETMQENAAKFSK